MRLLAFDPSLRNLGVAAGTVRDDCLEVDFVTTFYVDKMVDQLSLSPEWDVDENTRRVLLLEEIVSNIIANHHPNFLIIELPIYNGLNPKSLQVQMKAITMLELMALKTHDIRNSNIVEYMPNVIKAGIGIDTKEKGMGDKGLVTKHLLKLLDSNDITYTDPKYRPDAVDEHANDAVAMLYTKYKELQDEFS